MFQGQPVMSWAKATARLNMYIMSVGSVVFPPTGPEHTSRHVIECDVDPRFLR